jgi:hypothetical protein
MFLGSNDRHHAPYKNAKRDQIGCNHPNGKNQIDHPLIALSYENALNASAPSLTCFPRSELEGVYLLRIGQLPKAHVRH